MIGIILMFLDLISLLDLTLIQFNLNPPIQLIIMGSGYLIAKGFIFKDFMSTIDSIIGVYILLALAIGGIIFLYWIILAWFAYKLLFTVIFTAT